MRIAMNSFVSRQTPESGYSHYVGAADLLIALVEENFDKRKPGYRDGVVLVPVPPEDFFSPVVLVSEKTPLTAKLVKRREGEDSYVDVITKGKKSPAVYVEIVLYSHALLVENDDASTDAEWEIISINARTTEEAEPMSPMAMARNFLGLTGGTKAEYSAEEFARSIIYWSRRVRAENSPG